MRVTVIRIIGDAWDGHQRLGKGQEELEIKESRSFRSQYCWDRLEYSEEFWRTAETCCDSDSNKRLPVKTLPSRRKIKEKRKEIYVLRSCQRNKKAMEHESDGDATYNWRARNNPLWFGEGAGRFWNQRMRPSRLQHFKDRTEYWEEYRGLEKICPHSNSSESLSGYKLSKSQEKTNHLMYMDDIKLCLQKIKKNLKL